MLKSYDYLLLRNLQKAIDACNTHFAKCPTIYDLQTCSGCVKRNMCTEIIGLIDHSGKLRYYVGQFHEEFGDLYND